MVYMYGVCAKVQLHGAMSCFHLGGRPRCGRVGVGGSGFGSFMGYTAPLAILQPHRRPQPIHAPRLTISSTLTRVPGMETRLLTLTPPRQLPLARHPQPSIPVALQPVHRCNPSLAAPPSASSSSSSALSSSRSAKETQ